MCSEGNHPVHNCNYGNFVNGLAKLAFVAMIGFIFRYLIFGGQGNCKRNCFAADSSDDQSDDTDFGLGLVECLHPVSVGEACHRTPLHAKNRSLNSLSHCKHYFDVTDLQLQSEPVLYVPAGEGMCAHVAKGLNVLVGNYQTQSFWQLLVLLVAPVDPGPFNSSHVTCMSRILYTDDTRSYNPECIGLNSQSTLCPNVASIWLVRVDECEVVRVLGTKISGNIGCTDSGLITSNEVAEQLTSLIADDVERFAFFGFNVFSLVGVVVVFLVALCCAESNYADRWTICKNRWLYAIFVTLRVFDLATDWGTYAISLTFQHKGTTLRRASLVFCVIGSLLVIVDLVTLKRRLFGDGGDESRRLICYGMLAIVCLEDIPQIAIMSVYFDNIGADTNRTVDAVGSASFALSCISMLCNSYIGIKSLWQCSFCSWADNNVPRQNEPITVNPTFEKIGMTNGENGAIECGDRSPTTTAVDRINQEELGHDAKVLNATVDIEHEEVDIDIIQPVTPAAVENVLPPAVPANASSDAQTPRCPECKAKVVFCVCTVRRDTADQAEKAKAAQEAAAAKFAKEPAEAEAAPAAAEKSTEAVAEAATIIRGWDKRGVRRGVWLPMLEGKASGTFVIRGSSSSSVDVVGTITVVYANPGSGAAGGSKLFNKQIIRVGDGKDDRFQLDGSKHTHATLDALVEFYQKQEYFAVGGKIDVPAKLLLPPDQVDYMVPFWREQDQGDCRWSTLLTSRTEAFC